jgi:oligoendopeptidase F
MGQENQIFPLVNARERLAAIGVPEAAAEAFRAVALTRAPPLARAYAELHAAAYTSSGLASLPPRWRAPWPQSWQEAIDWPKARRLAVAGLFGVHPELGRRARSVVAMGRARIAQDLAPHTRPSRFGPPRVFVRFDGASETPLVLAHELGHATQMSLRAWGPSQPPPLLAGSEVAAHVAERGFHAIYAREGSPRAAAARVADDMLAMLVRHPARDALEAGGDWPDICAKFAPGHAWAADPPPLTARARAEPLSTLGYAMAAAMAIALHARLARDPALRDAYLRWVRAGPKARFEDAAALLGLAADDPALYICAYDAAMDDLKRCLVLV